MKATENQGVDLILDFVGASYWNKNLASVKTDGQWVLIGTLGGAEIEKMNIMDVILKRVQLTGMLLTPRSDEYKAELTTEFFSKTVELFRRNKIRPIIDRVFPFEQIGTSQ